MGWYVARIIGTHPQYGLNREFLSDVDPENPELPGDGLYEVQTRTRRYYLVEDGEVREIDRKEARKIAEKLGSAVVDPIAIGIEKVFEKHSTAGIRAWEQHKKEYNKDNVEAWERVYDIVREYAGVMEDKVAQKIWRAVAEMIHLIAYAYKRSGNADEVASVYLYTWRSDLLRWWLAIVRTLPKDRQEKHMERFAEIIEELYQVVQKYREEQGKKDENTENVKEEESKDAGLKGCD